ncbi:MAG: hypothetical protein IJ491_03550 [Clostridia bacterium]|nr:hypothetical protein [Clostridia bacterium]
MNIKEFFKEIPKEVKQGVSIALVIIFLFSSGNFLGMVLSGDKNAEQADATTASTTQATTASTAPATTTTLPPATTTTAPATTVAPSQGTSDTTTAPVADTTTSAPAAAPSTGAPQSKAEIIALFNESANKIKTNATSVTRNYEDMRHDVDKLQVPSALQSVGEELISKFLKKNETPETYSGADIAAKYPVAGESWVSKLTEAEVAEATCTDNGTEYEIYIKLVTQTDPAAGTGVANGIDIIKTQDVMDAAGFVVQSFSCEYYDSVIKCKIDKATGNMTWANYTSPIVMKIVAKLVVTLDAQVGMTFEKDYTIAY